MSTIRARHVRPPAPSSRSAWPFATLAELGPPVCWLLGLIAVFGIFVFEFEVTLPLVATQVFDGGAATYRSEEHTSELQSLMRISYAVFCLKKKKLLSSTAHHT